MEPNSRTLPPEQIRHIAHLARIELPEEDVEKLAPQLGGIIDYVNRINDADTGEIDPSFQIIPRINIFREDLPGESLSRKDALSNSPLQENGHFCLPPILNP